MNVLGAGGCDQGKEVGFRPIKKVAFVIKRVSRTTTAPLHFFDQSSPVTDSIISSKQVCRFNGGVARTINERLKKHGLEHNPPGIDVWRMRARSSLAKKNEVGK